MAAAIFNPYTKWDMPGKADDTRARKNEVIPHKGGSKKWEAEQSAEAWQSETLTTHTVCWLDFLNAYLRMAEDRFSRKTWKEKKRAAKLSLQVIGSDTSIDHIEPRHGLERVRLAALTSGNAANKLRKNLAAAWSWGQRCYGLSQTNPFLAVERFPADQKPRYVPPEEDFWKVYEVADSRDKVFLLFLLHIGARCGESFRLTWDDVDFNSQRVQLGTRKTADDGMKYVWLPMTNALLEAMRTLRRECPFAHTVFEQKKRGGAYTKSTSHDAIIMQDRQCEAFWLSCDSSSGRDYFGLFRSGLTNRASNAS